MGVVSNASGQIEAVLRHTEMCAIDEGCGVHVRVIVDSYVVGVAKPDPRIFDHALGHFGEFERHRIAYVGDSVTMDVAAATGAGLHPLLIDPYDDHAGADYETIRSVEDVLSMV
jgi:putative hydrolase of the HAD superfamily